MTEESETKLAPKSMPLMYEAQFGSFRNLNRESRIIALRSIFKIRSYTSRFLIWFGSTKYQIALRIFFPIPWIREILPK